jgi:NDP-sugar pyrophosphorylase family protein
VDVLSAIDLKALSAFHSQKGGLATMAVRERVTDRYLLFSPEMQLSGWRNTKTGEEIISRTGQDLTNYAFSGVQIVEPRIFPLITETGKFSLIDLYLRLAKNQAISGYLDSSDYWMDLGKPDQLAEAVKIIS